MIDWEVLCHWQDDWMKPDPEAIENRRRFLARSLSSDLCYYAQAVHTLRNGRARLVHGYADAYFDQLELDSTVATTSNLPRLLSFAEQLGVQRKTDAQRWFEAMSRFDQVVSIAKIEQHDPYELLDRDMSDLLTFLSKHFFEDRFESAEIYCYFDPAKDYEVREENICIGKHLNRPGLVRRKSELTCRRTKDERDLVYLRHRVKDPFDVWLKIQRQLARSKKEDPYLVRDRCGILLVVENEKALHKIAVNIATLLTDHGGKETELLDANHGTNRAIDGANAHSSSGYQMAKMSIMWQGREFEFQFLTLHDYFTSKHSLREANHELYRLKQATDYFLPLLWPAKIYGVDWNLPHVRHELRKWKESQIGLRVTNGRRNSAVSTAS